MSEHFRRSAQCLAVRREPPNVGGARTTRASRFAKSRRLPYPPSSIWVASAHSLGQLGIIERHGVHQQSCHTSRMISGQGIRPASSGSREASV